MFYEHFLAIHDVDACGQVVGGGAHADAGERVDGGGGVVAFGGYAADARGRAVEDEAAHLAGYALRQGEVGLACVVLEGGTAGSAPVEAQVFVVLVVRKHVEQATVALSHPRFDGTLQVVVVGRLSFRVDNDDGIRTFGSLDEQARVGRYAVAFGVAVVDGQLAILGTRYYAGLNASGNFEGHICEVGAVAYCAHLDCAKTGSLVGIFETEYIEVFSQIAM